MNSRVVARSIWAVLLLVAVLAGAGMAAACGEGGGDESTTTVAPTSGAWEELSPSAHYRGYAVALPWSTTLPGSA